MWEITLDEYSRLPLDVRSEFDTWLEQENLQDERIIYFRLNEGCIEAERHVLDAEGRLVINPNDPYSILTERAIYQIKTAPPKEAFSDY